MDLQTFYDHERRGGGVRAVLLAAYLVAAAVYFSWRVTVFNFDNPIFSGIFFAAEIATLILALMSVVILWKVRERQPATAPEGLSVDVFVPTYNEALPLVRRTVIAAMNISYPHETWLLDDGDRPQMRALAEELGCRYLRRDTNRGAKPGNLNNALEHASADFIAVIDCDHIAQNDYLDRLLGYFDDPKVAFVQAPQDYYNTNAFQYRNNERLGLLWHDQSSFFATGQAGRDHHDAATCCGTSTIVRRSVIDEIGGFPEETVTEDIHVAIKAQKLGYRSVYYPLPLAYGVAPVDLGEFQKQRLRWGQGNVQSVREEGLPFTTKLTFAQNVGYTYLAFLYAEGWARLVFYLTPPVVAFTGLMPIAPTHDFLLYFTPFFLISLLFFEQLGRGLQRVHVNEQMAMARFPVFIASTFAVFRRQIKWRVSSKEFIGHFQVYLLAPQLIVLALNLAAGIWSLAVPDPELIEAYTVWLLFFGVAWCAVNVSLASAVVRNAVRCARNKRADYRFALRLPVSLEIDGKPAGIAVTRRVSAVGMSFTIEGDVPVDEGSVLTGRLHLPGFGLGFRARLEPGHVPEPADGGRVSIVRCVFDWETPEEGDRLDMSLHACVWHRRLMWDGPWFLTPLEWIGVRLGLIRDGRSEMREHRAVLYGTDGGRAAERKLALLLPDRGGAGETLVAFEPLEAGARIAVTWSDAGGADCREMAVTEVQGGAEVASAGRNAVDMYTFGIKAAPARRATADAGPAAVRAGRDRAVAG